MATTDYPACPICHALAVPTPAPLDVWLRGLKRACALPCRCPGATHDPLLTHPHTRPGCLGYAPEEVPHAVE